VQAPKIETHTITGVILEEDKKGKLLPLINATVHCLNTTTAAYRQLRRFPDGSSIPIKLQLVSRF